jgi:hypothetical protein
MDGFASYEGSSGFLRWWPKVLLGFALGIALIHWSHWVQWSTVCVVCAYLHGRLLPWHFAVLPDGVELRFPFGRCVFLAKPETTVRLETVGAVAMTDEHKYLGYLLHDGVLYVPGRRARLRRALDHYGYRVV